MLADVVLYGWVAAEVLQDDGFGCFDLRVMDSVLE